MFKSLTKRVLAHFGYSPTRQQESPSFVTLFGQLCEHREATEPIETARVGQFVNFCVSRAAQSRAQLLQDLFVLFCTESKERGYFVGVGATDGISLSNTYLLEREYGWEGILAEPAKWLVRRFAAQSQSAHIYRLCFERIRCNRYFC